MDICVKLAVFADDLLMFLDNINRNNDIVDNIWNILDLYESLSGFKINKNKTEFLSLSKKQTSKERKEIHARGSDEVKRILTSDVFTFQQYYAIKIKY